MTDLQTAWEKSAGDFLDALEKELLKDPEAVWVALSVVAGSRSRTRQAALGTAIQDRLEKRQAINYTTEMAGLSLRIKQLTAEITSGDDAAEEIERFLSL